MSISYQYKEKNVEEAHGIQAQKGNMDFPTKKALKEAVKHLFGTYTCPNCGGHQLDGNKIIVEIGKVEFFKEEQKVNWFGSKKQISIHFDDVWRIHKIYLEPSGVVSFLTPSGYIRCRNCKWEIKGGKSVHWVSINDVRKGRF